MQLGHSGVKLMIRRPYSISVCNKKKLSLQNAHYSQSMWNLVNFPSDIFNVDLGCKIMHNANKTGALLSKLAILELSPCAGPVCVGGG